jgi:hypothetical protein
MAARRARSQAHRQQAARRIFKTDIKVVVGPGRPSIEPLPAVDFRPCRRICESRFSKKFFSKNFCTVGQSAGVRLKASGMAITGTAARRRK